MQIWNRATLDDYLQSLQERDGCSNASYAILLADIDKFKNFNDCYGHSAGDEALHSVAQAMRKALRTQDFIARYGGEEIAVICENADENVALVVGERLRSSVCQLNVPHRNNAECGCVTISVGVAFRNAECAETPSEALIRADKALYAAKRNGRNRVEVATPYTAALGLQDSTVES